MTRGKQKLHDFVIRSRKLTYPGLRVRPATRRWVLEATGPVKSWERKIWLFCRQTMESSPILASGLSEGGEMGPSEK
jgi:hypothetical protein